MILDSLIIGQAKQCSAHPSASAQSWLQYKKCIWAFLAYSPAKSLLNAQVSLGDNMNQLIYFSCSDIALIWKMAKMYVVYWLKIALSMLLNIQVKVNTVHVTDGEHFCIHKSSMPWFIWEIPESYLHEDIDDFAFGRDTSTCYASAEACSTWCFYWCSSFCLHSSRVSSIMSQFLPVSFPMAAQNPKVYKKGFGGGAATRENGCPCHWSTASPDWSWSTVNSVLSDTQVVAQIQ